jgi:hypothetical protein
VLLVYIPLRNPLKSLSVSFVPVISFLTLSDDMTIAEYSSARSSAIVLFPVAINPNRTITNGLEPNVQYKFYLHRFFSRIISRFV